VGVNLKEGAMTSRSKNVHKNRGVYNARSSYGYLRKSLAMPLLFSVIAMGCEPPAETPAQSGDLFTSSQERFEPTTGNRLESSFGASEDELQATSEEENVLEANFLIEVAQNYATDLVNMNPATTACSAEYIRDLDGRPTGFSVLYPQEGGNCDFDAMADHLNKSTTNAINAMEMNDVHLQPQIRQIRNPEKFIHVLVGATPMDNPLISLTNGLPPESFEELGRYRVAQRLGVSSEQVETEQVFYESLMPRGNDMGIVYSVESGGTQQSVVYLLPSTGEIRGAVYPAHAYQTLREAQIETLAEEMEIPIEANSIDTMDALRVGHLRSSQLLHSEWNRLLKGQGISKAAPGRTDDEPVVMPSGASAHPGEEDICDCWYTYKNLSTEPIDSCDNVDDDCCEPDEGPNSTCLKKCECECQGDWIPEYSYTQTSHGDHRFIRGIPILYQFDVNKGSCGVIPIGCGPIVIAELAIFYDEIGYKNLSDGHMSSSKVQWQDMTIDIHNNHVKTGCFPGVDATWVKTGKMKAGIKSYFNHQGYYPTVSHLTYKEKKEATALKKIKAEIKAGRPIVLGYDSDEKKGLGSDWGFIDHYGLISGYKNNAIFVNTGWGAGDNEWYYWNIGRGKVHLYTTKMKSSEKSSTKWCLHDGLEYTYLDDAWNTGYTFEKNTYDDCIISKQLVGDNCAVLDNGSMSTHTVDAHYAIDYESLMCPPTDQDFEDLENAIEEECEDNPWFPCP
jgi:hypothetical protein